MCAIAGLLFKNDQKRNFNMTTGKALTEILDATLHRGPDSAGWAIYKEPLDDLLRMRFLLPGAAELTAQNIEDNEREKSFLTAENKGFGKKSQPESQNKAKNKIFINSKKIEIEIRKIRQQLQLLNVVIIKEWIEGCSLGIHARYDGDILPLARSLEKEVVPLSIGTRLDILKDVGNPRPLAGKYNIEQFNGSHGIAHIRLATESGVHPETAHPFWACGFADIATVHNGQITNYWIMRRRLERKKMTFQTYNDTELIAVYLAYQMSRNGASLEEALKSSLDDLDGTFTYLVSTKDAIGYARDKLAAKPMVKYENKEMIAIASEEVGLNRLFPGEAISTDEPPPFSYGIWRRENRQP